MDRIATLFFMAVGLMCIYAGYKLFCGLPAIHRQGARASRTSVFLLNIIPGALLALAGTGLLAAQTRGLLSHRPAVHRHGPAEEGASWHRGYTGKSGFASRGV